MTERPILIARELAPAVCDGTKTQHREVIAHWPPKIRLLRQIASDIPIFPRSVAQQGIYQPESNRHGALSVMVDGKPLGVKPGEFEWVCPYGGPGDRLYWANEPIEFIGINSLPGACRQVGTILSLFDGSQREVPIPDVDNLLNGRKVKRPALGLWRGRRLPIEWARNWRWRVTDVRVQRVQEISEEDARAEGISDQWLVKHHTGPPRVIEFSYLWDSINATPRLRKRNPFTLAPEPCYVSFPWEDVRETQTKGGVKWYVDGNPWIWAITFGRVDA